MVVDGGIGVARPVAAARSSDNRRSYREERNGDEYIYIERGKESVKREA